MSDEGKMSKGLEALLGDVEKPNKSLVKNIKTEQIIPNRFQPRKSFNEESLNELADSIKRHGILSPIIVREISFDSYEIVAGERRFRAANKNNLTEVPCIIESFENQDSLEVALIENLQREDLNPVEEAQGYDRLKREFGLTQEDISSFTGKARSTIANALRILNLPQEVLDLISAGKIDRGHAKVLLSLKNTKDIIKQAKTISTQGISVSALNSSMRKKTKKPNTDPDIQSLIEELSNSFGHRVCISQKSKNKGQIEIIYTNTDEREIIIDKLKTFKGD
ncbi:ParB/RepB/Spo0J family partition protein [Gammaproteobacteria bacterium]|nr:ParB/RepB/Spo0J family partition protein [Gammaproteobacteria bacterium]|tara:strand:+ start:3552 stop:4391 length:840 start_codon:yes stop_codon:yes gene_type:complete